MAVSRMPPEHRNRMAFSLEVWGRQQWQVERKGCFRTVLKETMGSERDVWLQRPSQRASSTICEGKEMG